MPRNSVHVVRNPTARCSNRGCIDPGSAGLDRRAGIVRWPPTVPGPMRSWTKAGSTRPPVTARRNRYIAEGLAGLDDRPAGAHRYHPLVEPDPGEQLGISTVTVARSGCGGASHRSPRNVLVLHRPITGGQDP